MLAQMEDAVEAKRTFVVSDVCHGMLDDVLCRRDYAKAEKMQVLIETA